MTINNPMSPALKLAENELTAIVYAWVRDDCGTGLKMILTRKETDALISRLSDLTAYRASEASNAASVGRDIERGFLPAPLKPLAEGELLPCPFCGGPGTVDHGGPHEPDEWCGCCNTCDYSLEFRRTKADAIAAWNTRSTQPSRWQPISEAPRDGT